MRRVKVAAVWLIVAAAATYLFLFDPAKGYGYPSCPFRALTGLQCPGCGTARSLHQLLHGHPLNAFELNPLIFLASPLLLLLLLFLTSSRFSELLKTRIQFERRLAWIVIAVVVGFWIFRNTSLYPFAS
jgi:hypothetical protein